MSTEFDAGTWGVGIAGSIIAGMTGSFLIQKFLNIIDTKGVRNNVKNVIREELEVNLKSLKNENTSQSKGNIGGIKIVEATHSIMETWSFESAVKSGNYILLNKILRKEISEIYALMELANRQSKDIFKMTFVIITTEIEMANHKEIMKIQNENFIIKHKELIPKIESLIKKLNGS